MLKAFGPGSGPEVRASHALFVVAAPAAEVEAWFREQHAELRREWHEGIRDPVRRRAVLEEADAHLGRQLELVRRRRDAIAKLEDELVTRRRRIAERLRELERQPEPASS